MSYLKWKKKNNGRKSLFIITNPVTVILCVIIFVELLLPVVAYLRSLVQ
jgi:hypothetical protein